LRRRASGSESIGGFGFGACPRHKFVEARSGPEIDEPVEDVGDIGLRLDIVELASFNQRSDAGPVFCALVMTGEERVLAIENNRPFILPVSGLRSRSIIAGTRCTAGACGCITAKYGSARL
jgi:hypothetical protein